MDFNKVPAEKQSLRDQESTNLHGAPSHEVISHNMLGNNNIINSFPSVGILIVNKLLIMLIFIGVIWYNVFIEYIFSSQFIIN
jgi:hypothetical protein